MIHNRSKEVNLHTADTTKAQGVKRYYTGIPCAQGHLEDRLTSSNECVECKRVRERRKYQERRQIDYRKQLYELNREEKLRKQKEYVMRRYDDVIVYSKGWREQNKDQIRQYRKENAGLYAFHTACRRKKVRQATPTWAELDQIKLLYEQAAAFTKNTGVEYAVDHFVPITNDLVCGLHCIANLRIITRHENATKSNKFHT